MPESSYTDRKDILEELKRQLLQNSSDKGGASTDSVHTAAKAPTEVCSTPAQNITMEQIMEKLDHMHSNQLKMLALLTEINYKMRR
jgi:hypothetical protein